jgi:hypothetical protein
MLFCSGFLSASSHCRSDLQHLCPELHWLHVLAYCALLQLSNVFCTLLFVLSCERSLFTPEEIPPVFMLHSDLQLVSALYYYCVCPLCWFQLVLTFVQIQASLILPLKSASALVSKHDTMPCKQQCIIAFWQSACDFHH